METFERTRQPLLPCTGEGGAGMTSARLGWRTGGVHKVGRLWLEAGLEARRSGVIRLTARLSCAFRDFCSGYDGNEARQTDIFDARRTSL
jgi:hypothetical protein